ncbi:EAL domain-containing protein [Metabacillus schmidteae]|uniref:EAL domain-containing protein n=1 Tax=Metabacillus schmidteae TaxID=2730405 RepID=UPI00158C75EA|nr:EAL domain-containing protein [Metabacillus schmidteae]
MNNARHYFPGKETELKIELERILHDKLLSIHFQPIVHYHSNTIFGFEALSRGPINSPFYRPDSLFPYAEKEGLLYSLEKIAREKTFEASKGNLHNQKLFINLNACVIYDRQFNPGHTISLLKQYEIEPQNVVFEITERNAINDFEAFRNALNHYREQGFQIAVDDAGAGYSSLQSISELMPDYIKVDRSLIRGIDFNEVKSNILEAFVTFAKKMNSKIIAEGIETEAELKRVMSLGIEFGQGFFIAKPGSTFPAINEYARECIEVANPNRKRKSVIVDVADEIVLVQNGTILKRQPAKKLLSGNNITEDNFSILQTEKAT